MPLRNRGRNILVHHKTIQNTRISVGFVRYHVNISIHSKYIETFHYFFDTCIIKPLQIQYKTNVLLHDILVREGLEGHRVILNEIVVPTSR